MALGIDGKAIWENTGVNPPKPGGGRFYRVSIDTADNRQVTPGYTRHDGAVVVECHDDTEHGPENVEADAESIAAQLRRRSLSGLFLYTDAKYTPVGINEELQCFQGNLRVEWTRFENV